MIPAPAPALALPTLTQATFDKFRALIYEKTGIHMRDGKQILVSNRLRKRVTLLRLASYEEYYELLTSGKQAEKEMPHFIDAVSTNETYFFREEKHFSALTRVILPELLKTEKHVRIWSAGCSTGEEVYTLRIVADEAAQAASGADVQIVGTDISTTVIARAREGIYHERALRLVPAALLARCFVPARDGAYQVRPELRARVDFKVHNLFTDPPPADRINIIFCRNVMIYFDKKTQAMLVDGIFARAIHPEGYLFIGHSESISGFSKRFRYAAILKAPIYRPKPENPPREDTP
ncbi:MAG: CheR family methyltransferase [Spirochaetia bacterium]|nr:protein-glutamate O-methyltransferase CheR [Spirochaetia bacterium]